MRLSVGLSIGLVMAALGLIIAVRTLAFGQRPVTGSMALDLGFSVFFLLRGALQVRRWRQIERAGPHL